MTGRRASWAWPAAAGLTAVGIAIHLFSPDRFVAVFLGAYLPSLILTGIGCRWSRSGQAPGEPATGAASSWALTVAVLLPCALLRVTALGTWPPPHGTAFE